MSIIIFELAPVVFVALAGVVIEESLTISGILGGIMILVTVVFFSMSKAYAYKFQAG
jgi:hypothetical protein